MVVLPAGQNILEKFRSDMIMPDIRMKSELTL